MGIIDEIVKGFDEENVKGFKINVSKISDIPDLEKRKEKASELKDSTRAAKLAKIKIMISVYDQIKGLSAKETGDVLGAVCELIDHSGKMIALDEDLGRLLIKKGEKIIREILAELEKDEPAGD